LVAWNLQEKQVPEYAIVFDIYSPLNVRVDLHFNFKNVILLDDFLDALWLDLWLPSSRYFNILFIHGLQFLIVWLWLWLWLPLSLILIVLKYVNDLFLMKVSENVNLHFGVALASINYVKAIGLFLIFCGVQIHY
jgi:hypothetical protein